MNGFSTLEESIYVVVYTTKKAHVWITTTENIKPYI